ncbi:phosphotransferase family protein [Mycobacterium bourgelatii]|nr:phosphotransferase family protein [Mycobacterium bourgelatii]
MSQLDDHDESRSRQRGAHETRAPHFHDGARKDGVRMSLSTREELQAAASKLPDRLRAVLSSALSVDAASITVQNLRLLKQSSARVTWKFEAATSYGRSELILNMNVGERNPVRANAEFQAGAQVAASTRGVPVPRMIAASNAAEILGYPFVISELARGKTYYDDVSPGLDAADAQGGRRRLLRQCAQALVRIHQVEIDDRESLRQDRLAIYREAFDALGHTTPTIEWAFRWLAAHQPPPAPAVLVHGDFQLQNLLVDGSRLVAVIDWEWVHVGDAYEDLAWFCHRAWRRGAPRSMGAGGLGSIEEFLRCYEEAGGEKIDRTRFHWWRVMAVLLGGMTNMAYARDYLVGKGPMVKSAISSRQLCEAEWELLNLMDEAGH